MRTSERDFGLLVGPVVGALGVVMMADGRNVAGISTLALACAMFLLGLAAPSWLGRPLRLWMRLAHLVSTVVNPVVFTVLYYVVLTPIGLLARLAGKFDWSDPDRSGRWRSRPTPRSDLRRQF